MVSTVAHENVDHETRREAVRSLGLLGSNSLPAVPILLEAPRDREIRIDAAVALDRIDPSRHDSMIVPALIDELRAGSTGDGRSNSDRAAVALGRLGPRAAKAIPELLATLDRHGYRAWALSRLDPFGERSLPRLVAVASDSSALGERAGFAFRALAFFDLESAVEAIAEFVRRDPEDCDRIAALALLGRESSSVTAICLEIVRRGPEHRCFRDALLALHTLSPPAAEALEVLTPHLEDPDERTRSEVLDVLHSIAPDHPSVASAIGDAENFPGLGEALGFSLPELSPARAPRAPGAPRPGDRPAETRDPRPRERSRARPAVGHRRPGLRRSPRRPRPSRPSGSAPRESRPRTRRPRSRGFGRSGTPATDPEERRRWRDVTRRVQGARPDPTSR